MSHEFWFQNQDSGFNPNLIPGSLRFRGYNDNHMAKLQRTITAGGNPRTWTWSAWIKHPVSKFTSSSGSHAFFCNQQANGNHRWGVYTDDKKTIRTDYGGIGLYDWSNEKLTDPHGWSHIVWVTDTTQSASLDRSVIYINGERFSNNVQRYLGQNQVLYGNDAGSYQIIGNFSPNRFWPFSGHMADVHFIDGRNCPPTDFAEYNEAGIWSPAVYTGNYGTTGFHLDFAIPNNPGNDVSGNGNHFTPTGFELNNTSANDYDPSADSPTNNFFTYSPVLRQGWWVSGLNKAELWNGNLHTTGQPKTAVTAFDVRNQGKWYAEFRVNSTGPGTGILVSSWDRGTWSYNYYTQGTLQFGNNTPGGGYPSWGSGDVIGVGITSNGVTANNHTIQFYKNGSPAGNAISVSGWPGPSVHMGVFLESTGSVSVDVNFGQRPFRHLPSGFKALSTSNMPAENLPVAKSGTFNGNNNNDGPFIYTGFLPGRVRYGTIDVTYGNRLNQTNVDFLCNGFKVRSGLSNSGSVSWTADTTHTDGPYNGRQVPYGGEGITPAPAATNKPVN